MGVSFVTGATELQAASTREWIQLHKEKRRQESLPPEFPITRTRAWDPKTNKMDWGEGTEEAAGEGGALSLLLYWKARDGQRKEEDVEHL